MWAIFKRIYLISSQRLVTKYLIYYNSIIIKVGPNSVPYTIFEWKYKLVRLDKLRWDRQRMKDAEGILCFDDSNTISIWLYIETEDNTLLYISQM